MNLNNKPKLKQAEVRSPRPSRHVWPASYFRRYRRHARAIRPLVELYWKAATEAGHDWTMRSSSRRRGADERPRD